LSTLRLDSGERNAEHSAKTARPRRRDHNVIAIELLLNVTDAVIFTCESALLSTDAGTIECYMRSAKKSYAAALRYAGRLAFSVQDVQAFEFRTVRFEKVISKLEHRLHSLARVSGCESS
jgi:hypothetical protein